MAEEVPRPSEGRTLNVPKWCKERAGEWMAGCRSLWSFSSRVVQEGEGEGDGVMARSVHVASRRQKNGWFSDLPISKRQLGA
jgi:hypothetical protein